MDEEYQIVSVDQPEWDIIGGGINAYNTRHAGDEHAKRLCFVLKGPDQAVLGGVIGITYWDWLYIDLMWIQEELRGRGFGHRLLTLAEEEARGRGAKNVYLDTFSFQAPDFYKKHGYRVFGELLDFPPGHQRYFLTKQL
jgi:GNAT superfamily N-acetyltransferase